MKAKFKLVFCLDDEGHEKVTLRERKGAWPFDYWQYLESFNRKHEGTLYQNGIVNAATDKLAEIIANRSKNAKWTDQKDVYFSAEGIRL